MNIDEEVNKDNIGRFELIFKDTCSTFYAGDIISGNVEIDIEENIELRGIRAQFRGECYVYSQNRLTDGTSASMKGHQTIWNQLFTIWGKKVNEVAPPLTLTPGEHKFRFAVRIPFTNMPSSFEHRNGAIRYWVKVFIDRKDHDNNHYKPFTVLQKIDINDKNYQSSITNDAEKVMCCACFGSGRLSLTASIDHTGYCPGESISVNCRGKNQARRDMGGIKARLIQNVIYKTAKCTKNEETIISAIGGNKIERGRTKVWENQLLKVPAIPPTIEHFGIITILYKVQITMVVPNGIDLQFHLPITIGTIPRKISQYKANIQFKRCTDGIECFNHSSKSYNFPLLAYMPFTAYVTNFVFIPTNNSTSPSQKYYRSRSSPSGRKSKDEERHALIDSRPKVTFIT